MRGVTGRIDGNAGIGGGGRNGAASQGSGRRLLAGNASNKGDLGGKSERYDGGRMADRAKAVTQEVETLGNSIESKTRRPKDLRLLEQENDAIKEDIRMLHRKKDEVTRQIQEWKDAIFLKNEKIRDIEEEIQQIDLKIAEYEDRNLQTKQEIRDQEHAGRRRATEHASNLENLEHRLEVLEERDHEAREDSSQLRWELEQAEQELSTLNSDNAALKNKYTSLQASISSLTTSISQSESDRQFLEATTSKQEDQFVSNRELLERVSDDYALVLQKLRDLERDSEQLRQENEVLRERKQRLLTRND